MFIISRDEMEKRQGTGFAKALSDSFSRSSVPQSPDPRAPNQMLLLLPITDTSAIGVRNALIVSEMGLAIFNRKYPLAKASFLRWDRSAGTAVGAVWSTDHWRPISPATKNPGPLITKAMEPDFWDWLLGGALRSNLNELAQALYASLEWDRSAQGTTNITHKFAFSWVSLEALLPPREYNESYICLRYSMIVGEPYGKYLKTIRRYMDVPQTVGHFVGDGSHRWQNAIRAMYKYRCRLLHNGESDLNSGDIDPQKLEWFYQLSKTLNARVTQTVIQALVDGCTSVDSFWNEFAPRYLYSDKNPWIRSNNFRQDQMINFPWQSSTLPIFD